MNITLENLLGCVSAESEIRIVEHETAKELFVGSYAVYGKDQFKLPRPRELDSQLKSCVCKIFADNDRITISIT